MQLISLGINRNFNKEYKILTSIILVYEVLIIGNLSLAYFMVTLLGVKVKTIPIDRIFYLISIAININYIIFSFLILLAIFWRLRSMTNALNITTKSDHKKLFQNIKSLSKIWCKLEDLICSVDKYHTFSLILTFLNFFVTFLLVIFLGYDIFAHDLDSGDVIFFVAGLNFSFFNGLSCFIVIAISMALNNTMKISMKICNRIQIKNQVKKVHKLNYIAILQFTFLRKNFSCGLFDFNWKLIFTLAASFFSYLIMMIQFDYMLSINREIMSVNGTADVFFL